MGSTFNTRNFLLAGTVLTVGGYADNANAVPFSVLQTALGATNTLTSALGTIGAGGIGATANSLDNGDAVFLGATGTKGGTLVTTGGAGSIVLNGGTNQFGQINAGNFAIGTRTADPTGANIVSGETLKVAGTLSIGKTSESQVFPVTSRVTQGALALGASLSNAGSSIATVVNALTTLVSGGSSDVTISGSGTGTDVNGVGVTGTIGSGIRGYTLVDVTSQLTSNLVLQVKNPNDYFFLYLANGIGSGGSISIGSYGTYATGATLDPSHVIVVLGGTAQDTISGSTVGSYFLSSANTLTVGTGGKVTGGIYVNAPSTVASELLLTQGATITANPWNGYLLASTPEPTSVAAVMSGLVGLGAVRRRRRRA
jgi:hypothetical protein